jgi:hypothetical protein
VGLPAALVPAAEDASGQDMGGIPSWTGGARRSVTKIFSCRERGSGVDTEEHGVTNQGTELTQELRALVAKFCLGDGYHGWWWPQGCHTHLWSLIRKTAMLINEKHESGFAVDRYNKRFRNYLEEGNIGVIESFCYELMTKAKEPA